MHDFLVGGGDVVVVVSVVVGVGGIDVTVVVVIGIKSWVVESIMVEIVVLFLERTKIC